jgi:putative ABC transport system permease protein
MSIEAVWQDIRYAVRGLRKKPGFTIAVVLTLALGIGANAAMFGITDRLLFRAPYLLKDPDRVHRVYLARMSDGKEFPQGNIHYTRYKDLERWTTSFDVMAAGSPHQTAVGLGENASEMRVGAVSANFFSLFDLHPVIGRLFTAAEDTTPVGASVTVISYPFWQSRYGGRNDVIGQQLKIGKVMCTIIGVAPAGFVGPWNDRVPVAWIPITTMAGTEFTWNPKDLSNWYTKYNISWMEMYARRKPGVNAAVATSDLSNAYLRSYDRQVELQPRTTPRTIAKPRAILASVLAQRGPQANASSKVAGWVSGVAMIVMLIAAANVANLLLARALRRRREVAVRLALGVTRARLLSQLLTESLLLALLGGVAGLLVAQWGGSILRTQFLPAGDNVSVSVLGDARTLLFAGAAVLFVGLLTGLAPAIQSGRGDLTTSLKAGAREGTYHRSRTRIALLVLQGALSVVLLVGAGLFVRSLGNVRALRMGYDIDPILWVSVEERDEKFSDVEKEGLRNRLLESAKAIPGVLSASRARTVPFWMEWDDEIHVAGIDSTNRLGSFAIQVATPEYFQTMGTRLLRGRGIEASDTRNAPKVMVVSEAMAKVLWPGKDALGQCVKVGADTAPCTDVVGIAENIRASDDFNADKMFYYYMPIDQRAPKEGGLFIRTTGDAKDSMESIRRALQKLMPGSSYVTVRPMSEIYDPTIRSWRLGATMFVAFGGLALVLAAIGLYSVIAYNVVQRTHELGVRVAFGAQVHDVLRLILGEGLRLTIAGVVIGGAVALYAGKWVAPLLFNVKPTDPLVFSFVVAVLLLAATLACLIPAMRAARVDPNVALRSE